MRRALAAVAIAAGAAVAAPVTLVTPATVVALLAPLGAALSPIPAHATCLPEERIPTDSPLYRDLERLSTTYRLAARFLSMRPLRRAEASAFLAELRGAHADAERDPAYARAMRELVPDAPGGMAPLLAYRSPGGERIEASPYVSLLYDEDPRNSPDVNRDYRAGLALAASIDSGSVIVLDAYAGTASQGGRGTPDFGTSNALVEDVDFNTWFSEAYVEFPVSKLEILAGHTWLRWGPGGGGTLALSDAAPALDMLRLEATAFGNWRYQWFVAMLDPGAQTYLAGHRLEARLGGSVTAGFTEMARFAGTSQAPLYLVPLVPYSYWEKRPKTTPEGAVPGDTSGVVLAKNNVMWSADVAWCFRPGARAWGELMVDDISFSEDYKPDMVGYQVGLDVRRALATGRVLGVSAEYSRVHNYVYSHWTGHDFAFNGFPTGYVFGPDVSFLAGALTYEHGASWEFGVRAEYRRKGEGGLGDPWDKSMGEVDASEFEGVVEDEVRVTASAAYAPARWLRVEVRAGTSSIENSDHVPGTGWDQETPVRGVVRIAW